MKIYPLMTILLASLWPMLAVQSHSMHQVAACTKRSNQAQNWKHQHQLYGAHSMHLLGPKGPSKIQEVTLMRPFHGNL